MLFVEVIRSGGQSGADRAALDFAIDHGIPHRGWVPKGRLAEDGVIPSSYNLQETGSASYPERTKKNILDSDGTLIVSFGSLTGGSQLTWEIASRHNRPLLYVDLNNCTAEYWAPKIRTWLQKNQIKELNVAGPRMSGEPRIYVAVCSLLEAVWHRE